SKPGWGPRGRPRPTRRMDMDDAAALSPGGFGAVPEAPDELVAHLVEQVAIAWRNGWQPADLARAVRGLDEYRLVVDVIAEESRYSCRPTVTVPPDWANQLSTISAVVWWSDHRPLLAQWAERRRISLAEAQRPA